MKLIFTLVLAVSAIGAVQAKTLPESLLRCDSSFFSELYSQQAKFKNVVPLTTDQARHAWFTAPKGNGDMLWFSQPVRVGQLTLSGYWSKKSDLAELGKYYFWGLVIEESPKVVMAALSEANWQKAGDEYISNPMIKRPDDREWQANSSAASGIAPAKGSIEKLALLEVSNGKTKLLCSVQGSVTEGDLLPLRPDLAGNKQ
ncbi:hypothetical protein [Dickeya chrysanthemi]|uniref:hypothetical protein n=1 Tax=Dickeya chrysanthemi TaxID=556 RepID=UPI000587B316|nr:hypothetical protein [Dickeya chrysanthemi]MBX9444507.1 hypothetical protein [Dickeya chrysanthemi]